MLMICEAAVRCPGAGGKHCMGAHKDREGCGVVCTNSFGISNARCVPYIPPQPQGRGFRVGDKVICTERIASDSMQIKVGNVYTIIKTEPHFTPEDPWLYFSEMPHEPCLGHHFELAKKSAEFVPGNKVKLARADTWTCSCNLVLGKKYTIALINTKDNTLKLKDHSEWFHDSNFEPIQEDTMCVGPNDGAVREMTKEEKSFAAAVKEIDVLPNHILCGDGKEAIKKILGKALGVEAKEEKFYRPGDVVKIVGGKYIITHTDKLHSIIFVNLSSGTHWTVPFTVGNDSKITQTEMQRITGGFTYIGQASDVLKVESK